MTPRPFHLIRNSLFAGMTGAANILFLFLFLVAARYLGAEALGTVALGMAVGTAVAFGLNLGLNSVAIRLITTQPARAAATAVQLMLCRLAVSLIGAALLVPIVSAAFADPVQRSVVLLFSLSGVLRSINMSSRALLQASDRFSWESAVVFIDAAAILVAGCLVLHAGGGEIALAQVFLVVRGMIAVGYLFITPRLFTGVRWRFDRQLSKALLVAGFPLGVATALSSLYWQMDVLMLSAWSTALATGIFGAAVRIVEGLRMAPDTLGAAFYPRLATGAVQEPLAFDDVFARGCRYLLILGAASGVAMGTFGPGIIRVLYGDGFAAAGPMLVAMSPLPAMLFLATFAFVGLRALGREMLVMHAMVLAVAVKFLLALWLVRRLEAMGATLAMLGSGVVLLVAVLVAIRRARGSMLGLPMVAVRLLPGVVMATVAGLLLQPHSMLAAVVASGLLFTAGLLWTGLLDAAEVAFLRGLPGSMRARREG